ncbi:MAG: phosphotransferase family protein [Geodermatophilaceae bacterium]|nr:phosphotransferase family protein [Geodermatophilaceae bacterium]
MAETDITAEQAGRVTDWLGQLVPELSPPLRFDVIEGGRSNLTYRVADLAENTFALRRPPLSGLLPSAHDMRREHRVISALVGTDVPVPATIGLCTDQDVLGADFYVMDFVTGVVAHDPETVTAALTEAARKNAGEAAVDSLLALHRIDPDSIGLGDLGRGSGYVAGQLKRWSAQVASLPTEPIPGLIDMGDRLAGRLPTQHAVTIAHGDFRFGNLMLDAGGNVVAILDWELCTRGDPLADLGWLLSYWSAPAGVEALPMALPTSAPGFIGRDEALARYAGGSDLPVEDVDFYIAFAYWRLGAVLAGVYSRSISGAYGHGEAQQRGLSPEGISMLVAAAEAALDGA